MPDAFVPVLLLALVAFVAGLLAGRHLWPSRRDDASTAARSGPPDGAAAAGADEATDRDGPARDRTGPPVGDEGLGSALTTLEERLRDSEAELEQLRSAIGRRPDPHGSRRTPTQRSAPPGPG